MSFLDFDMSHTQLIFEMQYFDDKYKNDVTYEYYYRNEKGEYLLHFVPGIVNENIIKFSHYSFFEGDEGIYYMNEFQFHDWATCAEIRANCNPMNCKFINYELYKKFEKWNS